MVEEGCSVRAVGSSSLPAKPVCQSLVSLPLPPYFSSTTTLITVTRHRIPVSPSPVCARHLN